MAHEEFDVIVVGAGIMGSCTAYNTARCNLKTLLLDQFDFLHHRGSSHGESRTLRATYPEPYYSSMVLESARLWEEAQSEIGFRVYFPAPQLDMGPATDPSLSAAVRTSRSSGLRLRILTPDQVAEEFSGRVALPEGWIALLTDHGGVIKPTKAVSMFQSLALRNGAILRDNLEVNRIEKLDSGGVKVFAGNGDVFHGKKCVVTAGAWMRSLVKAVAGVEIPIQPMETTVMYWRIKDGHKGDFTLSGGFPTFASYGYPYMYGTPSLEYPGLIKVGIHAGRLCEPGSRTWAPLIGSEKVIGEWIREKFAGRVETDRPVMVQSCLYSMTPDEDFVIDFLGGVFGKDVVVAGGFSGHGFKMGPLIGRIVADMVTKGSVEGVEMKHFELDRFKNNLKGNVKEFGGQVGLYEASKL